MQNESTFQPVKPAGLNFKKQDCTVANAASTVHKTESPANGIWSISRSRAVGDRDWILTEGTAVPPEACTLPDVGIWNQEQVQAWKEITDFVHAQTVK
ncbi:hypothetical protein LRS05_16490 [Flavobacterium sp. J372]|uniref:hypothetical protein n=1 Tax=Flavobacterium sp. J372 TaxID=2898436 RepID=UPI002151693B|nr:hypothetical protein [Flavobacterium sp. J372]MCR5863602.1 hypothetical protein [Flavobacterium sp. J372]